MPFVNLFNSLPFAGLIFFIGLSTFTRNTGLSRFVRFNIQQALLLDIALIIPGFLSPIGKMVPYDVAVIGSNFVFYCAVLTILYSVVQNVQACIEFATCDSLQPIINCLCDPLRSSHVAFQRPLASLSVFTL